MQNDFYKEIIIDVIRFAVKEKRIKLFAFVIMNNHIHIVWQQLPPFDKTQVQLGFIKYTAQKIKFDLQVTNPELLEQFKVKAKDRKYQIWKRRPLSVKLFKEKTFWQKIDYTHKNPVKADLCKFPEEYKYSSAKYYELGIDEFRVFNFETP